jgi:hypothetical protein
MLQKEAKVGKGSSYRNNPGFTFLITPQMKHLHRTSIFPTASCINIFARHTTHISTPKGLRPIACRPSSQFAAYETSPLRSSGCSALEIAKDDARENGRKLSVWHDVDNGPAANETLHTQGNR